MAEAQRVARDRRGLRTTFDEIVVGDDLGSIEWSFTRDMIAGVVETDDDYHEWYSVDSPYGGVIAPVLISYPPVRLLFSRKYNVRGVFYSFEMHNIRALRPDIVYTISGRICDKWTKRDREFVQYEAICFDPEGREAFRTKRAHALDYLPVTVPKTATGIDSGAGGRPDLDAAETNP
jgi:hypothetical protein